MLPDRWSLSWVLRGELDPRALGVSDFSFPIPGSPNYLPRQSASQSGRILHNEPQWGSQLSVWVYSRLFMVVGAVVFCEIDVDAVNIFNLINNVQCCPFLFDNVQCVHFM